MREHILFITYGKDSLACLGAIDHLGWPLDRIVHAEVWATNTIPADLPPMVEFKGKVDEIIKERWGITVEHVSTGRTFEECFYSVRGRGGIKTKHSGEIYGWPMIKGQWCLNLLKLRAFKEIGNDCVQYLGIAADEKSRIIRHMGRNNIMLPLVEAGWEEDYCGLWCKYMGLLSPIYSDSSRGGCWFCHCQSTEQLRSLRKKYPDLWELMLRWDKDSPVTFKGGGHTVSDYDNRFWLEDQGLIDPNKRFYWDLVKNCPREKTRK